LAPVAVAAVAACTSVAALAAGNGEALFNSKACLACHGPAGKTPIQPTYPKLAGQNAPYLAQQIKDIRDGKRTNGLTVVMKPIVQGLTDDQAQAIADYLAGQGG